MCCKHLVKAYSLWCLDDCFYQQSVDTYTICHGIWMVNGLQIKENGLKLHTLTCVSTSHKDLKIGDTRYLIEIHLLYFCHPVQIIHLPKIQNENSKITCSVH